MMVLAKHKIEVPGSAKPRKTPLWLGPQSEESNGGISQSMLNGFLACRERFKLKVIDGLSPHPAFIHAIEYGQFFHLAEETRSAGKRWEPVVDKYAFKLVKIYPDAGEQILHWLNVCKAQFPVYLDYWKKHSREKNRKPLMQEVVFHVPYKLPSGKTVWLKGKWDGVERNGTGKARGIYLNEHKSKGDIREEQLVRQLQFDLQTMIYLVAMNNTPEIRELGPLKGVRYNVIRRPLSGGKGSIRQRKGSKNIPAETPAEFYERVKQTILDDPEYFFMRWMVRITDDDIKKFETQFLIPILEQLCVWYDYVTKGVSRNGGSISHYRTPYGIYNTTREGRVSEVDEYLDSGSMLGLTTVDKLFGELQ